MKCEACSEESGDGVLEGGIFTCSTCVEDAQCEQECDEQDLIDGVGFADPGGNSALRAATKSNPRNLPCPTCKEPNRLTPIDVAKSYQCNRCADRDES